MFKAAAAEIICLVGGKTRLFRIKRVSSSILFYFRLCKLSKLTKPLKYLNKKTKSIYTSEGKGSWKAFIHSKGIYILLILISQNSAHFRMLIVFAADNGRLSFSNGTH